MCSMLWDSAISLRPACASFSRGVLSCINRLTFSARHSASLGAVSSPRDTMFDHFRDTSRCSRHNRTFHRHGPGQGLGKPLPLHRGERKHIHGSQHLQDILMVARQSGIFIEAQIFDLPSKSLLLRAVSN